MLIDTHTHWAPTTLLNVLEERTEFPRIFTENGKRMIQFAPSHSGPLPDDMWREETKLAKMDRDGIDLAVVSVVGGISAVDLVPLADQAGVARAANEELAELIARHPGRFAGLAALPMQVPDKAAEELEHAVAKLGLRGAMVYSNVNGRLLDEPAFRPVFETAARLGVPIQIHPTHPLSAPWLESGFLITAVGFLYDTTTAALRLIADGIYEELPDLKLQLGHVGSLLPFIAGRIDFQAGMFPADVTKLSAPPSEYARRLYTDTVCLWVPALQITVDFFGAEHVMYGTDDPYWPGPGANETLAAAGFAADVAETIRWRGAQKLFGLEVAAPVG